MDRYPNIGQRVIYAGTEYTVACYDWNVGQSTITLAPLEALRPTLTLPLSYLYKMVYSDVKPDR
jgi:hypothetical protein